MRVLVVEDNSINQRVVLGQLALLGVVADLAEDGPQAVERARRGYDLLLVDVQLPGFDGYEVARRIRRDEAGLRRVRMIAVTAGAMAGETARGMAAGMDGVLSKPLLLEDLRATLLGCPVMATAADRHPRLDNAVWRDLLVQSQQTDPTLVADLGTEFPLRAARAVADISDWLQAGQVEEAQRGMHRLAGSAGVLGLRRLAELLRMAERTVEAWPAAADEVPRTVAVLHAVLVAQGWMAAEHAGTSVVPSPPLR